VREVASETIRDALAAGIDHVERVHVGSELDEWADQLRAVAPLAEVGGLDDGERLA
jgi:hypothetical protein